MKYCEARAGGNLLDYLERRCTTIIYVAKLIEKLNLIDDRTIKSVVKNVFNVKFCH